MRASTSVLLATLAILALTAPGLAGTEWLGNGATPSWADAGNWLLGSLPAFDGTETLTFALGFASGATTTLDGDRLMNELEITTSLDFSIDTGTSGLLKLTNVSRESSAGSGVHAINANVELQGNSTWSINGSAGSSLQVYGVVSDGGGAHSLDKTSGRRLYLHGDNTYTGATTLTAGGLYLMGSSTTSGVTINGGALYFAKDDSLGAGTFTINGGRIGTAGATDLTINNPVTLNGDVTVETSNTSHVYYTGLWTLTGDRKITSTGSASKYSYFTGGITDGANTYKLTFAGSRTIRLETANTYDGGTEHTGSNVYFSNNDAFGSGTITLKSPSYHFGGVGGAPLTISNPIVVDSNVKLYTAINTPVTYAGPITLTGDRTLDHKGAVSGSIKFTGGIGDGGNNYKLTLSGNRIFELRSANTHGGGTELTGGTVKWDNAGAFGTGSLTLGGGNLYALGAQTITNPIEFAANFATSSGSGVITMAGPVTMTSSMTIDHNGNVGQDLIIDGDIGQSGGDWALTVDSNQSRRVVLNGDNSFAGGLTVADAGAGMIFEVGHDNAAGPGTLSFSPRSAGTNTRFRASAGNNVTIANDVVLGANLGTLRLGGSPGGETIAMTGDWSGTGSVSVLSGATLGGTGTISGTVTIGGGATLAPGASTGILATGDLSFTDASSIFRVELNGTTPGSGYDQADVTGLVTLGGATLEAIVAAKLQSADVLTIIDNDGADVADGVFDGLAEGAIVTLTPAGQVQSGTAVISYIGGDGNDITLTDFAVTLNWILGDMDGSGAVNNNDITPFVLALTDRATYLATYPGIDPDVVGDIDASGALNNNDITPFVTLLTTGSYPQAVPEPATMALLTLGGLALLRRRSR